MQDAIENCKHRRTCIKKIYKKKNIAKEHMHTRNNNNNNNKPRKRLVVELGERGLMQDRNHCKQ
jgi:hypothetical protein